MIGDNSNEHSISRAVLDGMGEGFILLDRDFKVIEINAEGLRIDGRPRDEIVGRHLLEVWPEAETLPTWSAYQRAMAAKGAIELEYQHLSDQHDVWLEVRAYPIDDGLAVFYRDVTARRLAEDQVHESEARFQQLASTISKVFYIHEIAEGRIAYVSPAFETVWEQPVDTILTNPTAYVDAIHPDDRAVAYQALEKQQRGEPTDIQYRLLLGDRIKWIADRSFATTNPKTGATRIVGMAEDITARREAQLERDRAAALLKSFVEAVPGVVYAKDREGRVLVANRGTAELVGKPLEEITGRTDGEYLDDTAQAEIVMANDRRIIDSGKAEQIEEEVTLPDGARAVWLSTKAPLRNDAGEVIGLIGSSVDITERKRAEAALAESERRFRNMADHAPVMTWVTDASGHCTYLNRQWYEFTGQTPEEAEGFGWLDATHPDDKPMAEEAFLEANAAHTPFRVEYRLRRADGTYRWAIDAASPRFGADGEFLGFVGSVIDIDERREVEDALLISNNRFRAAIDAVQGVLWTNDADGRMVGEQPGWAALTGQQPEQYQGYGWSKAVHSDDAQPTIDAWEDAVRDRRTFIFEHRVRRFDGAWRRFAIRAIPTFAPDGAIREWVGVHTDVTEQRANEAALRDLNATLESRVAQAISEREKVEEALRQSQKMEAVGQLTGGIAHDFNNLLTVVTGNIDMALRNLAAAGLEEGRIKRSLDNAMKGAERAATLTQRLLAFSRRQPLDPKPLDVDRLVVDMSDLLNRALGETVKLEVVTSPGLWRVEADPNQLESAILNLAVNARDAMPAGGTLTIETANARLDEAYAAEHAEVAPGHYVVIAVTDTGEGMSREVTARVFEPFFTTKEVGRGTGLGLSQVYGFTKQSGGHVKIYSEEGQGTTVKIYLPRLLSDQGGEEPEEVEKPSRDLSRGRETIMVVEDDDDVRAYTVDCLRDLGYQVLEAHDGPAALRLLERQEKPIDLLFTDVVMPGMTGRELADAARAMQPDLKVLYTSGYTRNAIVHGGRLDEGVEMVTKPFTYQVLGEKIADMLEVGRTGRLLLVEDDPTVRMFAAEALAGVGYAVDEAATSAEALSRVRAARGRYDAVVLDVRLPDRSGDSLAAELRAMHLDMPILIASGEHAAELADRFTNDRCTGVIGKPYNAATLTTALQELGLICRTDRSG